MKGKIILFFFLFGGVDSVISGECDVRFVNKSTDKQEFKVSWKAGVETGSITFRMKHSSIEYHEVPCPVGLIFNVESINQKTMKVTKRTPVKYGLERKIEIPRGD